MSPVCKAAIKILEVSTLNPDNIDRVCFPFKTVFHSILSQQIYFYYTLKYIA